MAKTMTAEKAYAKVLARAEEIRNDDHHTLATMSEGDMKETTADAWAQGDIAVACLGAVPAGAVEEKNPSAQLAPGTTQGSRHVVQDMTGVRVYRRKNSGPLEGPVLDCPNGLTVTHPEHGWVTLPPGVYSVEYQRALADEVRRVQD